MFLKVYKRNNSQTGESRDEFRLTESFRRGERTYHQSICNLGTLSELPDVVQKQELCKRIEDHIRTARTGLQSLFQSEDTKVEELAAQFFEKIKIENRIDVRLNSPIQKIDTNTVENHNVRELGAEWLCKQAMDKLEIAEFLRTKDWNEHQIELAYTHIISRAVYPASEYKTTKWIKQNSSVCEITNYPEQFITKDKLYNSSKQLFGIKDPLENHLSTKTNELFDIDDSIILYDLTNTYYEGLMKGNKSAKFGRSKEKRNDARLIVLALVVNEHGFLKYSQLFEGNKSDDKTLVEIIGELSHRTSSQHRQPIIVLDAGIATEDNLTLLRSKGFKYMCVSRSSRKKYEIDPTQEAVMITDKRGQPIQILRVKVEGSFDTYYRIDSEAKRAKEQSMNLQFAQRFEQGLEQIKQGLAKKSGIKTPQKVWERIGRLKQKYPSIHRHFEIEDSVVENKVIDLHWNISYKKKNIEGQYLLRTNLAASNELMHWKIYNTIREIESTFRTLKTDLDLRPIYHKTEIAGMAHLHLGILAYWVVNTIRYQLKAQKINLDWKELVRIMNTQKLVTTSMVNEYHQTIVIRQSSEPIPQVKKIYQILKFKEKPFTRKKFVVPPPEHQKNIQAINQAIISP